MLPEDVREKLILDFGVGRWEGMRARCWKLELLIGVLIRLQDRLKRALVIIAELGTALALCWSYPLAWLPENQIGGEKGKGDRNRQDCKVPDGRVVIWIESVLFGANQVLQNLSPCLAIM
jgi:hypothetical protein